MSIFTFAKQISSTPRTRVSQRLSRRTLFRRFSLVATTTTIAAGVGALAPLTSAGATGLTQHGSFLEALPLGKPSGINVVLVHGAFADGSSWSQVIPLLQRAGHHVLVVQLPLVSLDDDIAVTRQALASLTGPTVLTGHSYGGAVVTGAGTASNVVSLVYVAAYVPDEGETVGDLNNRYPVTDGLQHIIPAYLSNTVWIDPAYFPQDFAGDVEPTQARILATVQKPTGFGCLTEQTQEPAWKSRPSWYLVSKNDRTINPDLERWMAKRIGATTRELASSHASLVSHPLAVFQAIQQAAEVGAKQGTH